MDSHQDNSTYTQQFTQIDGHQIAYIDEGKGVPCC